MEAHGITSEDFETWLKEEKQYLESLKHEPAEEALEMEYYTQLVKFYEYEYVPFHFTENLSSCVADGSLKKVELSSSNGTLEQSTTGTTRAPWKRSVVNS